MDATAAGGLGRTVWGMSYSSDLTDEQWALLEPASTHENRTSELMLERLTRQGVTGRLELVLVDRGITAAGRLGRSVRLAKSFENTTLSATGWLQVACIATTLRHLSRVRAHVRAIR